MDLKTIINKCLGRDDRAFEQLYAQYAPSFRGVCLRYASSEAEADDILQDAYIKIFKSLKQLKNTQLFEAWAKRIVINTALQYIRERKKISLYLNVDVVENELSEEEETTSLETVSNLTIEELINLMGLLPDGYRTILNLYAIEGFSHKEIGDMLNIKETTSRSQYFKAKKAFQQILLTQETACEYEKCAV